MESEQTRVSISKIGENDPEVLFEKIDSLSEIIRISANKKDVVITDINMPFKSMVSFMVKWAIASIPAVIILMVLGAIFAGVLSGIVGSLR
jgi:hypothetical protein